MASALEKIINDTKESFIAAKRDGKLEVSEVIQIALQVSMKVHALSSVSFAEKEAFVLLCLKKGLASADGLKALASLSGSDLTEVESQILQAGIAAASALRGVAPPLRKNLLACLLPFCSAAQVLLPNESALIQEALKGSTKDLSGNKVDLSGNTLPSSPEFVVRFVGN